MEKKKLNWKVIAVMSILYYGGFVLLPNEVIFFCLLAGAVVGFLDHFRSFERTLVDTLQIVVFLSVIIFACWAMVDGSIWMIAFRIVLAIVLAVPFIMLAATGMLWVFNKVGRLAT